MTDNAAPSYQPTTSDGIPYQQATTGGIPYQQNTPAQYQPPIEVYQPVNSYGSDVTYRTPCNCIVGFIFCNILHCWCWSIFIYDS